MRSLYIIAFLYIGISGYGLLVGPQPIISAAGPATANFAGTGGQWFQAVKPYCNTVEVEMIHERMPPPRTHDGAAFSSACYALAGKIGRSRSVIMALPHDERWKAAGVVFDIAHPIADMGDDQSAGPIMELVVEFWPNHWMALYHAGMSRYGLSDYVPARKFLKQFLQYYPQNDGWTRNAQSVLNRIDGR